MTEEKTETKVEKEIEEKKEGSLHSPLRRASELDSTKASPVDKVEDKKEEKPKKETKKEIKHPKKTEAFALGSSLPISTKHSKDISRFISGKNPDEALELLEKAKVMKIAIPFRGEIPHRKGKGMMSGRYPVNAVTYFIRVLKSAIANASLHSVNVANSMVHSQADMASRPYRRGGSERFKRTNLKITISEIKPKSDIKQVKENKGAK